MVVAAGFYSLHPKPYASKPLNSKPGASRVPSTLNVLLLLLVVLVPVVAVLLLSLWVPLLLLLLLVVVVVVFLNTSNA